LEAAAELTWETNAGVMETEDVREDKSGVDVLDDADASEVEDTFSDSEC
jgi:hypothetical protein